MNHDGDARQAQDHSGTHGAQAAVPQQARPPASAGECLRVAREAAGVSVAELATQLKVAPKSLTALESNQWDELPDVVFARALAASVCRLIRADPQQILSLMPAASSVQTHTMTTATQGLNQSYRERKLAVRSNGHGRWISPFISPFVWGAVLLLMASVLVALGPNWLGFGDGQKVPGAVEENIDKPVADLPPAPPQAVTPTDVSSVHETATPGNATVSASLAPVLYMVAKGPVWVEVKDVHGQRLVQRILKANEALSIDDGAVPLHVVVGRSDEIASVAVRGVSLSLAEVSSSNKVARFKVD